MRYQKSISKASVSSHNSPRPFAVSELKWILSEMRGSSQWMWLCGWGWSPGMFIHFFLLLVVVVCVVWHHISLLFPLFDIFAQDIFGPPAVVCLICDCAARVKKNVAVETCQLSVHLCITACVYTCLCVFVIIWTGQTEILLWPSAICSHLPWLSYCDRVDAYWRVLVSWDFIWNGSRK